MLASFGLGHLPVETVFTIFLTLVAASIVMGWICDAILDAVGPGLGMCCGLCFVGMVVGFALWGSFTPVRAFDVVTMLWVGVGSAFGAVLSFAVIQRLAA